MPSTLTPQQPQAPPTPDSRLPATLLVERHTRDGAVRVRADRDLDRVTIEHDRPCDPVLLAPEDAVWLLAVALPAAVAHLRRRPPPVA